MEMEKWLNFRYILKEEQKRVSCRVGMGCKGKRRLILSFGRMELTSTNTGRLE